MNWIFLINWVISNFCFVQEIPNSSQTDSLDGHDDTEAPACLLPPPPIPPLLPAIYPHYSRCSFLLYFSNHAGFFPTTPPSLLPTSHSTLSYLYPRSQLSYECSASNLFLPSLTIILSSFLLYPFSVFILLSLSTLIRHDILVRVSPMLFLSFLFVSLLLTQFVLNCSFLSRGWIRSIN